MNSANNIFIKEYEILKKNEVNKLYDLTKKTTSNVSSYLYTPLSFWINDNKYLKFDNGTISEASNAYFRPAAVVNKDVEVSGSGSYSDPWNFVNSYSITFHCNGDGEISESNEDTSNKSKDLTVTVNASTTKTIHLYPKTDKIEYKNSSCSSIMEEDKNGLTKLEIKAESDMNCNLYFGEAEYTVTYMNGDTEIEELRTSFSENSGKKIITSEEQFKDYDFKNTIQQKNNEGYDFLGWSTSKTGAVKYIVGVEYDCVRTMTLYAKWGLKPDTTADISYDDINEVKVLNVTPKNGSSLGTWLSNTTWFPLKENTKTPNQKVTIKSIKITEFNNNYIKYLEQNEETGKWEYDVIVFGFADCNGKTDGDLSIVAAKKLEEEILKGLPVVFGHDTLVTSTYCGTHTEFNKLAKYVGTKVTNKESVSNTNQIEINQSLKNGLLLSKPYNLNLNTSYLKVAETHSSEGLRLLEEGDENYENADYAITWLSYKNSVSQPTPYLFTYSNGIINTAYVSTGHSNGKSTEDESKILVNLLFYMYARSYGIDH